MYSSPPQTRRDATPPDRAAPLADLAIVGGGPAGSALALRATARGLRVAIIDPAHGQPWPATYGIWDDEIPAWLPDDVVRARMDAPVAFAHRLHHLDRPYSILSTGRLQAALTSPHELGAVHPRVAVATRPDPDGATVLLAGGGGVRARVIVDCTGSRRVLSGGPPRTVRAAQTAFGIVVPDQDGIEPAFMDWRDDHGEGGWPTFLYAVPMGKGSDGTPQILLEETALARRPALDIDVLRRRLRLRLAARGIEVRPDAPSERVRFVLDTPPTAGVGRTITFGAAAPTVHPATGYSLGTSFGLVDDVLDALTQAPDRDAAAAARQVIWPRSARLVHHLRRRGLEAVLALPPAGVVDFFDVFFSLPPASQRTYLSERADVPALLQAMWQIFRRSDNRLRRHLWRWGLPPIGDHRANGVSASWE